MPQVVRDDRRPPTGTGDLGPGTLGQIGRMRHPVPRGLMPYPLEPQPQARGDRMINNDRHYFAPFVPCPYDPLRSAPGSVHGRYPASLHCAVTCSVEAVNGT